MSQLYKKAHISRFADAGIEDAETANSLSFMEDFYNYDRSREPDSFSSIHSRPNSQLEKTAFKIRSSRSKMKSALEEVGADKKGKWNNKAVTDKLPDKIKTQKKSLNAKDPSTLFGKGKKSKPNVTNKAPQSTNKGSGLGRKALAGGALLAGGAALGAYAMKKKKEKDESNSVPQQSGQRATR